MRMRSPAQAEKIDESLPIASGDRGRIEISYYTYYRKCLNPVKEPGELYRLYHYQYRDMLCKKKKE